MTLLPKLPVRQVELATLLVLIGAVVSFQATEVFPLVRITLFVLLAFPKRRISSIIIADVKGILSTGCTMHIEYYKKIFFFAPFYSSVKQLITRTFKFIRIVICNK